MPPATKLPKLPDLIEQKLTKTGYTRGAADREIYQNRVTRNNPVLIDLASWPLCRVPDDGTQAYENGHIVLVEPEWYFTTHNSNDELLAQGLVIGENALLLFLRRSDWVRWGSGQSRPPNGQSLDVATSRRAPLGGTYFARVHATVSEEGAELVAGFNTTAIRGAGIRVYEYASRATIAAAKLQLECLMWRCYDSLEAMVAGGMTTEGSQLRRDTQLNRAANSGLLDLERLRKARIVDAEGVTICPLCLECLSVSDFMRRGEQAEGRATYDLTVTELSLFHVQELRVGKLLHKPYNLGWGHHFCNVVAKDVGILPTLDWMTGVLANQDRHGHGDLGEDRESIEEAVEG